MTTISLYAALALSFACGISCAALLFSACIKPSLLARGYTRGHRVAHQAQLRLINDYQQRIKALHSDLGHVQHQRDIERHRHQTQLDAIIQDADERIAVHARRASDLTAQDATTLNAAQKLLEHATGLFDAIQSHSHARQARQVQQQLINMAQRTAKSEPAAVEEAAA